MTTIDDLVRLVPPPVEPVDARGDWGEVEVALGLKLPADFKTLIERYGGGEFVDFIGLMTPFGPHESLVQSARALLDSQWPLREEFPDEYPYPFYPEPGGLLEWAGTAGAQRLCWLTDGEPDSWRVVAWGPRDGLYDTYDLGAVEFLHAWLSGRITTSVFGEVSTVASWFEPYRECTEVYIALSEGELPYPERLRILREALAPTVDRRVFEGTDGQRQDGFAATGHGWRLTYETTYGHQIRAAFPPEDDERARVALFDAINRMGCHVLSTTDNRGEPAWT
jgi:SMI1-KNR4 cell-wall